MELQQITVDVKASKTLKILPIGDVHMGAVACDLNDFRRVVKIVADDNDMRWLGMGDMGDLIMPSDPRWDMTSNDWKRLGYSSRVSTKNLAVEHVKMIRRELEPIKDKCLGLLD